MNDQSLIYLLKIIFIYLLPVSLSRNQRDKIRLLRNMGNYLVL